MKRHCCGALLRLISVQESFTKKLETSTQKHQQAGHQHHHKAASKNEKMKFIIHALGCWYQNVFVIHQQA